MNENSFLLPIFTVIIICPNISCAVRYSKYDFETKQIESMKWPRNIANFTINIGIPISSIISTLNTQDKKVFFPDNFRYQPL